LPAIFCVFCYYQLVLLLVMSLLFTLKSHTTNNVSLYILCHIDIGLRLTKGLLLILPKGKKSFADLSEDLVKDFKQPKCREP